MSQVWERFKAFWGAEEIPRSLGLLLVLVYLVSLGAIGIAAHRRMTTFAQSQTIRTKNDAIQFLADTLEPVRPGHSEADLRIQGMLVRFTQTHHCLELRVYDRQSQVLASLSSAEVHQPLVQRDTTVPLTPDVLQSQEISDEISQTGTLLVRAAVSGTGQPATQFVEGVFELRSPASLASPLRLWTLLIALACTGAFWLVYRRLRQHFHSFSRIADNLVHNAEKLEHEKSGSFDGSTLRIDDARDRVAECWNKLIDLTATLDDEVSRSAAATELLAALSKTNAGDLAEAMISVPIGVVLASDRGSVTYANAMARRLMGWPKEADGTLSLDDEDLSCDGRKVAKCFHSSMQENGSFRTLNTQIEGEDESHYYVQVVPVRTPQQANRFVALILDVSQQVRADKAREEFVSQVTHELRTPLTNIRAYAETLSSGMFDDPQVITECYNVITKETRRLSRLVEDILSISQLEVGTMQLVFDNVDLRTLLTEAVRDVRGISETKSIDLQLVLPPKLDPLRADRDKLAVVANNLLGNAIKYTPEGGQVTLSCTANDDQVLVSVRDTGIGIDVKDHGRIFEKFQRCDDEAVRNETGTGIGLTTAREIVQQHGGDITLVSKKGEGATFTVGIPTAKRANNSKRDGQLANVG